MTKRNVIVRFLGNDLASDKNWMIKHLLNLMNVNKLNKKINLFEAKLYKVERVTKIENIKTDSTKILRPTRILGPKNIKTDRLFVGLILWLFFFKSD